MAIALVITLFVKYFNKAMVIFSTNKKAEKKEKIVCTKMMLERIFLQKKISHTPLQKKRICPLKNFIIPFNFLKKC